MTLRAGAASEVVPKDAAEAASPFVARFFEENATAAAMDLEGVTEAQLGLLATFCRESWSEPFVETSEKLPSWSGQFDLEVSTPFAGATPPLPRRTRLLGLPPWVLWRIVLLLFLQLQTSTPHVIFGCALPSFCPSFAACRPFGSQHGRRAPADGAARGPRQPLYHASHFEQHQQRQQWQ